METLSIDRIEGEYAVCETADRTMKTIALTEIAGNPKEGDVICREDGTWRVSPEETGRRREQIIRLQKQLFEE